MNDVYLRIEHLCQGRNLDVTTMCKEAEVSRAALSEFKMGRTKKLSTATLAKIAAYFDVSVDFLLGNTDDSKVAVAAAIPTRYHNQIFSELKKFGIGDDQIKRESPRAAVSGEGFIVDDLTISERDKVANAICRVLKPDIDESILKNAQYGIKAKEKPATTEGDGLDEKSEMLMQLWHEFDESRRDELLRHARLLKLEQNQ